MPAGNPSFKTTYSLDADVATFLEDRLRRRMVGVDGVAELVALSLGRVLTKAASKGETWASDGLAAICDHIIDWMAASVIAKETWLTKVDSLGRTRKVMKFSKVTDIVKEADKAVAKAAQRRGRVTVVNDDETPFADLADGYRLVRLVSAAALDKEGSEMRHCVGDGAYDGHLGIDGTLLLSLRDKQGKSHATIEIRDGRLTQLRGKQNKPAVARYLDLMAGFFKDSDIDAPASWFKRVEDIHGDWHKLTALPECLEMHGSLRLSGSEVDSLPSKLTVGGDLDITESRITVLPAGLRVGGNLYLTGTKVTALPDGLSVGENLYVQDTEIMSFPANLSVRHGIFMRGCQVKQLPEGMTVGYLDLDDTEITTLPDSIGDDTEVHANRRNLTAREFRALRSTGKDTAPAVSPRPVATLLFPTDAVQTICVPTRLRNVAPDLATQPGIGMLPTHS
jgi:hypothetical protein